MSATCNEMAFFPSNFMLQTPQQNDNQTPPSLSPLLPSCTPQDFHGVASFLGKRSMSFSGVDHVCKNEETNGGEDDLSDDGSQAGLEKKRRLSMEQVKTLEKSFELGNKLEPERKMQLARALGLQPRQIAIWFQNRRARWKTKQLEKDYDLLKRQFEALQADNDALQAQNQKLQAEILALKSREPAESINLNIKETEGSSSNRSENSSDNIKLDISTATPSATAGIESPLTSRPFFPSSSTRPPPTTVAQFFNANTNNPTRPEIQFYKTNNNEEIVVKEENSFNNMLQMCGIDDQSGSIWPWLEQQHFN